ncbi:hypothetical protein BJD20_09325 [Acinetobacter proteolyticus]|uniref:TetR/AcrR family transcriptional regulator n=1 Tax=Acinetobacter proteolyticus TaxID=1776741 RepID=UPI0008633FDE|nr:TetR/AcrR family transcriptional regulator [Acinetobacter proteolyticus]OEY92097.1 hypothetical protein BJD20_09325 [Acinetobacter proteolyticus]
MAREVAVKKTRQQVQSGRPKHAEIEQREKNLLQSASDTFLKFGFNRTTMDTIAENAHVSKRTLYTRYRDKTDLFNAVVYNLIEQWLTPIGQLQFQQGNLRATLHDLARCLTAFTLTPQAIGINRIIIAEAQHHPEFGRLVEAKARQPALDIVCSILSQHQSQLKLIKLDLAAEQFMSLAVDNNLRQALLGIRIEAEQVEAWVCSSVDLFLAGLHYQEQHGD